MPRQLTRAIRTLSILSSCSFRSMFAMRPMHRILGSTSAESESTLDSVRSQSKHEPIKFMPPMDFLSICGETADPPRQHTAAKERTSDSSDSMYDPSDDQSVPAIPSDEDSEEGHSKFSKPYWWCWLGYFSAFAVAYYFVVMLFISDAKANDPNKLLYENAVANRDRLLQERAEGLHQLKMKEQRINTTYNDPQDIKATQENINERRAYYNERFEIPDAPEKPGWSDMDGNEALLGIMISASALSIAALVWFAILLAKRFGLSMTDIIQVVVGVVLVSASANTSVILAVTETLGSNMQLNNIMWLVTTMVVLGMILKKVYHNGYR